MCCGMLATCSENDRRFSSPVRLSVDAWSCVSAITRSSPMRAPASLASVAEVLHLASSTSSPGSPVAWITPTVRPMIDTGTHRPRGALGAGCAASGTRRGRRCRRRAESGRAGRPGSGRVSRRCSTAALRRGRPPAMRSRWAWLLSASSSSTGDSGSTAAKDRSITSMTSGSPSAMSSAFASRLSNRWRRAWVSRMAASRSPASMASVSSAVAP